MHIPSSLLRTPFSGAATRTDHVLFARGGGAIRVDDVLFALDHGVARRGTVTRVDDAAAQHRYGAHNTSGDAGRLNGRLDQPAADELGSALNGPDRLLGLLHQRSDLVTQLAHQGEHL